MRSKANFFSFSIIIAILIISCSNNTIQTDAPTLSNIQLDIEHDFSDSIFISVAVFDPQGREDIDSVWALIGYINLTDNPRVLLLLDNGTDGDSTANDGVFSAVYLDNLGQFQLGPYQVQLRAKDLSDNLSNLIETVFWAIDGDRPILYNEIGPDSLERGSTDTSYIMVNAYDPDGLSNIDSLYFLVTRPDLTQNPYHFYMHDDGQLGDTRSGDGRYTLGILPPTSENQAGVYRFVFHAFDDEGHESNNPDIYITVY